jgi:methionine-S-sulfoxide reductase
VDARFGAIEGVIRTRVGYAGGQTKNPDYGNIGDHTEAVQLDFDPQKISYATLLAVFWESHRPDSRSWKRQYLHAVFHHDARQEQEALESKTALEDRLGRDVRTEVLPLRSFTRAEDYHQKYILKREPDLMRELSRMYPNHTDLVDSTAAARLNGYVGGHGSPEQFRRESEGLGLSPEGRKKVENMVRGKGLFN